MKQLTLVAMLFISISSFAAGFSKGSAQLSALGSAWHSSAHQVVPPKNDIEMVYGGEDVSNKPTSTHKAVA